MTGSAPTFLSAISWIASKTVASGAIDQTAGFFRAKSTPTVPAPAIPVGMWPIQRQDSKWKNCTPVDLRCPVTLKVISERYLGDESAQLRFLREARAAASVRHPNVASVFHLGRTGSSYFACRDCRYTPSTVRFFPAVHSGVRVRDRRVYSSGTRKPTRNCVIHDASSGRSSVEGADV